MNKPTLDCAEKEAECPMCEGRGIVETVEWVEHLPYKASRDCEWCGGDGKLPIFQKELLDE